MNLHHRIKTKIKETSPETWLVACYLIFLSWMVLFYFNYVTLDLLFIFFFVAAFLLGLGSRYLKDWGPVLIAFLAYEALRGMAPHLNARVNITNLIQLEHTLFGNTIPSTTLQNWLYTPGQGGALNTIAALLYSSHFYIYFLVAFILWYKKRELFLLFTRGFLLLTFAALLTYIIFPAMPPWMASTQGYLPKVHRIIFESWDDIFGTRKNIVLVYKYFEANQIAAMPSLHAAWPFFTFLFLTYTFGKKWLPLIILPLGVGFSAIYLGEHYAIDVLAGYLYATIAFLITAKVLKKRYIDTSPSS